MISSVFFIVVDIVRLGFKRKWQDSDVLFLSEIIVVMEEEDLIIFEYQYYDVDSFFVKNRNSSGVNLVILNFNKVNVIGM